MPHQMLGEWFDPKHVDSVQHQIRELVVTAHADSTGDIYTDWDIDQLAETLLEAVDDE